MNVRLLIICLFSILLFGCDTTESNDDSHVLDNKKINTSEAASYNTQLGLAYLKQGNRPRAKRKLLTALSQAPKSPTANAAMGYFLEKTGELDDAKVYYQKALSLAPNSGAQLNNYGTFLCRQAKYQEAEQYFMKAVKDVKYENTGSAYENAGLCALGIPDESKAIHFFSKALEQDPSRTQSLYELTTLKMKEHKEKEAMNDLKQYQELTLSDPSLLALAANLAHKIGNTALETDYRLRLLQLNRQSETTGA